MNPRDAVLAQLAQYLVVADDRPHPTRVAIDGVTAAGKSTFAAELTDAVTRTGWSAVHLSTDDFHHLAEHRRRNPDPARGYYEDAFDLTTFRRLVLDPLGPGGDRHYRPKRHDLATDELIDVPAAAAPVNTVVLVDGTFLQSAALAGAWDAVIWLDTSYPVAVERAAVRDLDVFGDAESVRAAYARRYHAACRLYLAEHDPIGRADVVVANDELDRPRLVRLGRPDRDAG